MLRQLFHQKIQQLFTKKTNVITGFIDQEILYLFDINLKKIKHFT